MLNFAVYPIRYSSLQCFANYAVKIEYMLYQSETMNSISHFSYCTVCVPFLSQEDFVDHEDPLGTPFLTQYFHFQCLHRL